MFRRFRVASCAVSVLVLAAACSAQVSQPSFHGLGDLPGGAFNSKAWDVSGNGMVVVGEAQSAAGTEACRWLRQPDGTWLVEVLGDLAGGGVFATARGASFDGSVIAGFGSSVAGPEGFRWTQSTGLQPLGDLPGGSFHSNVFGISADGSTIVGNSIGFTGGFMPVFWPSGASAPTPLSGVFGGHAQAASGDGSIIVGNGHFMDKSGQSLTHGVRWIGGGMSVVATDLTPDAPPDCAVLGISDDGAIMVGTSNGEAFIAAGAGVAIIGPGFAYDVSTGGTRAVGFRNTASGPRAFIREPVGGMRDLHQFLTNDVGLDLTGWTLTLAYGISNDGNTIVGHGVNPSGQPEGWVAYAPTDADGDGLLDLWETQGQGIDINGDRVIDLDLFALGARPDHKDLFIEIDCMTGRTPADLQRVVHAFANAPVTNPDGSSGIVLHLEIDDVNLPLGAWSSDTWTPFYNLKSLYYGTAAQRTDPNSIAILEAKQWAYRYCIYADTSPDGVGEATLVGNTDFVVFKGGINASLCPGGGCNVPEMERATFMHELGHALGLGHGTVVGTQVATAVQPNYISVMNYLYDLPWGVDDMWRLDYSHGTMLPILEHNIDESLMLQTLPGDPLIGTLTYYGVASCPLNPCDPVPQGPIPARAYVIGSGPFDFNQDGQIGSGACMDINYFGTQSPVSEGEFRSPCEILNDQNDWLTIQLKVVPTPAMPEGGDGIESWPELSIAEIQAMFVSMPPPPCRPDVTGDDTVNIDDLLAVISAWGPCPALPAPCVGDIAPLPVDGQINIDDLLAVISAWGSCR